MFSQNKSFRVFSEMELYTSQTETKKIKKKTHPEKNSFYFRNSLYFGSNIKKILILSQKEAFLILPTMEPCTFHPNYEEYPKSTLRKIPYASGTKTLKKVSNIFFKRKLFLYSGKRKLRNANSILFFIKRKSFLNYNLAFFLLL